VDPEVRKPLIVGNWKMHGTVGESIKRVTTLKHLLEEVNDIEVGVAPPFTSLYSVSVALSDTTIALVGQNLYWEDEGAFTGEVSGPFLKDVGCDFVLVGHSERRQYFGETDKTVSLKVQAALKSDLVPIVCVGESLALREKGKTLEVIETQMKMAFSEVAMHDFEKLVVAYEPIWAIGTGKNATPAQAGEVHHFIRTWLTKYYDAPTANRVRVLYGGSVNPSVAPLLMKETHIDGLLVGGASLNAEDFANIVKFEKRMN
jgi:triosephosphate isomerase (TIM)